MEKPASEHIKQREIEFAEPHPDPQQAHSAAALLLEVPGILQTDAQSAVLLHLQYDLREVTLQIIEDGLCDVGFHLSNRLLHRIRRSLFYYSEEVQRSNLGCPRGNSNCTQKIFISHYERGAHGCRDQRPEHWRNYR